MDNNDERRVLGTIRVERRADNKPVLVGHAAVFDKLSVPLWGFREKVAKGAFGKSIGRGDDVKALIDHDSSLILGRSKARTLKLKEDDEGLAVEIFPPDTQVGRDAVTSVERGDLDQMSFGFRTVKDQWDRSDADHPIRTLIEVDLFDVSIVAFPAYPDTDVALRGLKAFEGECLRRLSALHAARARQIALLTLDSALT